MLALGLQGSPRAKGNCDLLLSRFMAALAQQGARTHTIEVTRRHIEPCKELTACEKKGFCPIDDDMAKEIYGLLREADIIVAASPIFFYGVTAQLKALIDRCQTLWARKYMLKLKDPGHATRQGFFLGVGATRGKQLFDGVHLTAKYFFDGISARYAGSLTYRGVEGRGHILEKATMDEDIARATYQLTQGLTGRRKVLFACRENACRSQMAAAFARYYAGDRLDADCAGSGPARQVNPMMIEAMQELGIDMAFRTPLSLEAALARRKPGEIITMGCAEQCPVVPGAARQDWDLPDPAGQSMAVMRRVRDLICERIKSYVNQL